MVEIIILIAFGRKLREILEEKGRSNAWVALGVLGWIGGELFGIVLGGIFELDQLAAYGLAVVFAAIGATIAYVVIKGLAPADGRSDGKEGVIGGVDPSLQDPSNPFNPPRR